ncbi:D-alanyl-D-alanine carboxypeptidase family protein [Nocardioides marmorisolisilvae]|nr:serine hydrolase [Nocardioides marmorisolisilvae]
MRSGAFSSWARTLAVGLVATSAFLAPAPGVAETAPIPRVPAGVTAAGAILIDQADGSVLMGRAIYTERPMASTTKIMTAVVVLETPGLDLDARIPVKSVYHRYAVWKDASTAHLHTGDSLTVRQLLYGLLLPSGSDAAYALADRFGHGSTRTARTAEFISRMNAKAAELGLSRTQFGSFDGLAPTSTNHITPRSLARLASYALGNEQFAAIVRTRTTSVPGWTASGGRRIYTWENTNQLLGRYWGVIGVKTGTTTPAGACLVFAITRGGRTLVGVVLHSASGDARYRDARLILDAAR